MNAQSDSVTAPIDELITVEAWEDYAAGAESPRSVPAFLLWLKKHEPHVLQIVKEPALIATAERLVGGE